MRVIHVLAVAAHFIFATPAFSSDDEFVQAGPRGSSPAPNLVNPRNGEVAVPTGPNYTNTRDGTLYVPAGPSGVIDTRSGRFIPTP
jgi:hypothetical protein